MKSNLSPLVGNSRPTLKIKATIYHRTSKESFYRVEYRTVDAAKRTMLIGREQFRKPTCVVDILLKAHADLTDDEKKAVDAVKEAVRNRSNRTYDLTNRTGGTGIRSFTSPRPLVSWLESCDTKVVAKSTRRSGYSAVRLRPGVKDCVGHASTRTFCCSRLA